MMPAAGLLALSTAVLTLVSIALGAWVEDRPPNLPRSALGLCLTVILAMTIGRMITGSGWGWGSEQRSDFRFGQGPGTGKPTNVLAPIRAEATGSEEREIK